MSTDIRKQSDFAILLAVLATLLATPGYGRAAVPLAEGFAHPPPSAKPGSIGISWTAI